MDGNGEDKRGGHDDDTRARHLAADQGWGKEEKLVKGWPSERVVYRLKTLDRLLRDWPEGMSEEMKTVVEWLYLWARDMHVWSCRVRDDILTLERFVGIAEGNPGDPPMPPPK